MRRRRRRETEEGRWQQKWKRGRSEVLFFSGEGVTGESERDGGETKGREEGTVRLRDAWFVCSLALHPA